MSARFKERWICSRTAPSSFSRTRGRRLDIDVGSYESGVGVGLNRHGQFVISGNDGTVVGTLAADGSARWQRVPVDLGSYESRA
ncbi:MAG: hypothetical protein HY319_16675 [Armatimonadetes bacterium]|nr:hypothetical protein [Armatimonadota bacterium]